MNTDGITPIDSGWHIKDIGNGMCIDVLKMLFNYRVVLSHRDHHQYVHGWCYFGHGLDKHGNPRSMESAKLAAILAAAAWNGHGCPPGFDKQAF